MFSSAPDDATGSDDVRIRTRMVFARVQALFDAASWPMIGGLGYSLFVVPKIAPGLPATLLYGWLAWRCLTVGGRLAAVLAFRRDPHAAQHPYRWLMAFTLLQIPDTLGWAAMPILFMPLIDGTSARDVFASIVGVGALGAITTWHHALVGFAFVIALTLPMVVNQFWLGATYTGIGILVYAVMLGIEVWRAHARLGESLLVQLRAETLAEHLKHALTAAEASGAAKIRFLAAASHELRTPLNGVVGMAQLLRADAAENATGAAQAHRLDVLNRSASHLQVLIDDLVDLARLDAGRLELHPVPVALAPLLHDVVDLLQPLAQSKGLKMVLQLAPDVPEAARIDPARLRQVLFNLIGNAVKYTPEGRVDVRARGTAVGLSVDIADTGAGIPDHLLERVFQPFEQASAAADARRGGSGLGLTISRELARAMGGDVRCHSRVGEGSTFELTVAAPRCPLAEVAPSEPHGTSGPLRAAHVLVVDDNPVNTMVAEGMLERLGLSYDSVNSGTQALARLAQRDYDAVLMDCLMPDIDGYEATRRWRTLESARGSRPVPIIALTANAVAGDREACLAAGMDDYLAKPFQLEELMRVLARHLKQVAGTTSDALK